MTKWHLLASTALAVSWLAATTTAAVAQGEPPKRANTAQEERPHVKPPRRKHATVRKPAKHAVKPILKPAPAAAATATIVKTSTDVQQRLNKPGDYRFAIQHGGLTRTYRVHVPVRYAQSEPAPLLVALHGGGIDAVGDDGFDGLTRASELEGFIAVLPDAYVAPGKGKKPSWNAGNCCGDARDKKVNDIGFIEQVVSNVFRQVSIERQRIYAAGISDGGMMAYKLACELPFVFRAVASVGGTDNTAYCKPGKEVSVVHFHAKNDPHVPFSGGAAGESLDSGKATALTSAPETVRKWARVNGCDPAPRRILDQAGAYCEAYTYCRRRTEVRLCVTDTGGHSWPGAKARGRGQAPSQAIAGTEAMWGFFVSH